MNGNGYAILSHRWQGTEISFQEIKRGVALSAPAFRKIINACNEARSLGYEWLWVDTCCINKESQTELVESINSMFQWYLKAAICLGFLVDVEKDAWQGGDSLEEPRVFQKAGSEKWQPSEWFSRGTSSWPKSLRVRSILRDRMERQSTVQLLWALLMRSQIPTLALLKSVALVVSCD